MNNVVEQRLSQVAEDNLIAAQKNMDLADEHMAQTLRHRDLAIAALQRATFSLAAREKELLECQQACTATN